MFFRHPPAYDCIIHDSAPETEHVHRTDEPIIAKKRKKGLGGACVPMALLQNRQAVNDRGGGDVGCSQNGFRGSGESHTHLPSMNPFLAKIKRPSLPQPPATSHLIPPIPPRAATSGFVASTVQPRGELKPYPPSKPKSKPSTVSVMSPAAMQVDKKCSGTNSFLRSIFHPTLLDIRLLSHYHFYLSIFFRIGSHDVVHPQ
ncbi:hypothetical protein JB92DRAFT_179038 [Gautieria morchelliformis]|nr:hypothetical protein JB92DRAFT_179038 [Gautieria morchelliformis]